MFAYPCPACSQRLLAPEERAGQRTICPKCLHPLTVPQPEQVAALPFGPLPEPSTPESFTPPPAEVVETPVPSITEAPPILAASSVDEGLATHLVIELDPVRAMAAELNRISAPAAPSNPAPAHSTTAPPTGRPTIGSRSGQVMQNPTGRYEVDVAAELSAAISMRMAPPPEPTLDRSVVLTAWGLGLALGLGTWALGVFHSPSWFPFAALVGATMAAFGYLWRAYLSGRGGDWRAGVATLIPPIGLVQLFRPVGQHRLRPLVFVLTGLGLWALFLGGPAATAKVDEAIGPRTHHAAEAPEPSSPAAKLRAAKNQVTTMAELSAPEKVAVASADERTEMARELKDRLRSDAADVRTAALTAFIAWAPEEGLAAAVERLGQKADREAAKRAVVKFGPTAEAAVLPLLTSASEPVVLTACEVLEHIGGERSLADLRKLADAAPTRAVRVEATTTAAAISTRIHGTK